jgi:hypothetical protein
MSGRPLTFAERSLTRAMFGDAIDLDPVRIHLRRWWLFQPREVVMAPDGAIWCHPRGSTWRDCFADCDLGSQALFIHEMTHIWQHQQGIFLPLRRHPFCRYRYRIVPGRGLTGYGIEQQAEIVRHAFLLRNGVSVAEKPPLETYEALLPFG